MKAKQVLFKNVVKGCKSKYEITDLMIKQGEDIKFWGQIEGFYENELMKENRISIENQAVKHSHVFNFCKLYIELED